MQQNKTSSVVLFCPHHRSSRASRQDELTTRFYHKTGLLIFYGRIGQWTGDKRGPAQLRWKAAGPLRHPSLYHP